MSTPPIAKGIREYQAHRILGICRLEAVVQQREQMGRSEARVRSTIRIHHVGVDDGASSWIKNVACSGCSCIQMRHFEVIDFHALAHELKLDDDGLEEPEVCFSFTYSRPCIRPAEI